jgi:hypothetical protein
LYPYPDTTALALMALRGRAYPVMETSFSALENLLDEHASILALSLAVLAQRSGKRDHSGLARRLADRIAAAEEDRIDSRSLACAVMAQAHRARLARGLRQCMIGALS